MSRLILKSFAKTNLFSKSRLPIIVNLSLTSSANSYGNYHTNSDNSGIRFTNINKKYLAIFASSFGLGLAYCCYNDKKPIQEVYCAEKIDANKQKKHETVRKDLPTYSADDVSKHSGEDSKLGIWVTYGIGVYDITKFVPEHPGSKRNIMLGAGAAIDPFWHIYQQHNQPEVLSLLEKYRIGNLKPEDHQSTADQGNPFANEPKRHPVLVARSTTPFNAEPPLSLLVENFITPTELFFTRNHLPVPDIDIKDYELEVEIESSGKSKTFKMDDLKKKYEKAGVVAVVMCGGNRRSEMNKIKEVKGLSWGPAAVGNAVFTGVRLCDFLKEMGVSSAEEGHVILEGYDTDPTSTPYAASIPLSKAMDPRGDVILAYEMNGKPLTRDHGFPLRCIVPGTVGARNVKWLGKIIVSKNESDSHWQQNDYKAFSPSTDWDTVDFKTAPAIQNLPVTSSICTPNPLEKEVKIVDGCLEVKGYAYSGGGNKIIRVDVTTDGGKTWQVADLEQMEDGENVGPGRHYAWTLWTAKVPLEKNQKVVDIWSKAVDSSYNCQPETHKNTWNLRGVVVNAYSRVRVSLNTQ